METALLLVLLLFGGVPGRHLLHLTPQRLDFCFLLLQQAFLCLDFLGIHCYLLGGNQRLVKNALLVIGTIAVVDPLDKLKQPPQRRQGVPRLDIPPGMYSHIAQLCDVAQFLPGVLIHGKTEARLKDQGFQIVFIGHIHGLVSGIHPFDGQLHGLAAAYRAQCRGRGIDLLRLHAGRGKEGVFRFLGEEGEVGHINHSLLYCSRFFFFTSFYKIIQIHISRICDNMHSVHIAFWNG